MKCVNMRIQSDGPTLMGARVLTEDGENIPVSRVSIAMDIDSVNRATVEIPLVHVDVIAEAELIGVDVNGKRYRIEPIEKGE